MSAGPVRLFLASFLALFLELLLVRWIPSVVRPASYYANLMLLASFLGLGCGALLARRVQRLGPWLPLLLLPLVVFVVGLQEAQFAGSGDELRFSMGDGLPVAPVVVLLFVLNAVAFVPAGNLVGGLLAGMDPRKGYALDLGGSLAGTVAFAAFSYTGFSPVAGLMVVGAGYAWLVEGARARLAALAAFAVCVAVASSSSGLGRWSPYNFLSVSEQRPDGSLVPAAAPPADLGTMVDPPRYVVSVNGSFYMLNGALDLRRYTAPSDHHVRFLEQYMLPHRARPGASRVLVVGSGGGVDVEAALLAGASHVDAVEIDPVIVQLGKAWNASGSYRDPRVEVHLDDARAFLRGRGGTYDMVVFGFLDSQGLFSQLSSVRIDGYVYTLESLREAWSRLADGGLLSLSFTALGQDWLADRLYGMVAEASGVKPEMYITAGGGNVVLLARKGAQAEAPPRMGWYQRVEWKAQGTVPAEDDWPFLYLKARAVPPDYLVILAVILLLSGAAVRAAVGGDRARGGEPFAFFFLLGVAFLLLETRGISSVALLMGATWMVTTAIVAGVLFMALVANMLVPLLRQPPRWAYVPLVGGVLLLHQVPVDTLAGWSWGARLAWCALVIPLPMLFAGLLFSWAFARSRAPSLAFGFNLVGAMVGGVAEYAGMAVGSRALLLVVALVYVLAFLAMPSAAPAADEPAR